MLGQMRLIPSGVYEIRNLVNGNRYIGSTARLEKRWQEHLSNLRSGQHHNPHLQAAFDKYGEAAFSFSVLERVEDTSQLTTREQHFLDTSNPEYNLAPNAGSTLGYQWPLKSRRKMSEVAKNRNNIERLRRMSEAQKGEPLSEEHRRKISRALKGHSCSEETKQKLRAAWTPEYRQKVSDRLRGKPRSAETRRKISEAHRGIHPSSKTRRKISKTLSGKGHPNFGKHLSAETRRKISESERGKYVSEETRQKLSKALTEYWRRVRVARGE